MNKIFLLSFFVLFCISNANSADIPDVLVIGDSISLGYTPNVIAMMHDEANVVHHKGNAQHTGTGLAKIDAWLGDTEWDVIHFNWGLWDLCYRHPESKVQGQRDKERGTLTTSLEQYEQNLNQLVQRLRKTNATLIWANTTVVPQLEAGRRVDDDLKYNAVAARVMQKHGVVVNDLNKLSRKFSTEMFKKPGDVHFTAEGYQQLAVQVSESIRSALQRGEEGARTVSQVFFGSCIKQEQPMPLLAKMADLSPDLMIFLGDNIYGDTEDMDVLRAKYAVLSSDRGFQRLRQSCPTLATWDDHDFGVNDGGADYSKRLESERIFEDFWFNDLSVEARSRPGVYDAKFFGPPEKRLQVIMLDTRYFRSPLKQGDKRIGGSWLPDSDPSKTMLGEDQWTWLEEQLSKPANVRIIASSIQFLAEAVGQETWSNLPRERHRMLDLLKSTNANGVIFISGDRHWSELSSLSQGVPYPIYDFTSSSFNQLHGRGTPTENRFRHLPNTFHQANYGVIRIDWDAVEPSAMLEIRDLSGETQLQHQVDWEE
ncbi:alkaline phosphatase D family protein [Rubripirellula reticaptiva]|uniref:Alkaline phosphatase D n=1 Tax=Rubripirellula reticaptiva TaxID=2528013 RepID=A0A5C6ED52_9BACT|nr:alkaline phosphatase D family protein [Rubripirellula reticaptiva]TWU46952.1 Alkaline phosphatase D precursor [Rubripirellula reticaptiva]